MCEEQLKHLEVVFKWLEAADWKIKCSKCEFFKTKGHYLGFLVGVDGVQPLPEKVVTIQYKLYNYQEISTNSDNF